MVCTLRCTFSSAYCQYILSCCFSGSGHELGLSPLTIYGLEGTRLSVLSGNRTGRIQWKVAPKHSGLVRGIYRRLEVSNVSQFAGGFVKYDILTDGIRTGYSSAKAHIHVGSKP